MNSAVKNRLARLGLLGRVASLAMVVVFALGVAAPIGALRFGAGAWVAAIAAAATVLVASALADAIAEFGRRVIDPALAVVGSMMVRMGLALMACLIVHFSGGRLAAGGYIYFLLAFYLIVLPLETALEVTKASCKAANHAVASSGAAVSSNAAVLS